MFTAEPIPSPEELRVLADVGQSDPQAEPPCLAPMPDGIEPWWWNPVLDWMVRHAEALWLAFWWLLILSWPAWLLWVALTK
ncbi:MAG: hypothetical protein ACK47B_23620 [Armatimonadota bacterium]